MGKDRSRKFLLALSAGIAALLPLAGNARPVGIPTITAPTHLEVKGPLSVPDTTQYTYRSNCPTPANWEIAAPGTPHAARGQSVAITWGAGPAEAVIKVTCGKLTPVTLTVDVVQITIEQSAITLGKKAKDGGVSKELVQLVDTKGPPPALKVAATIQATGPKTGSPHWGGKIATGFVQRLMAADAGQWVAAYADNAKPKPHQNKLSADTTSDPPPKSDYVDPNGSKTWYAEGAGYVFRPSANDTKKIAINDSPGPGWWHFDQHKNGLLLREAHAIWQFETYVCVQSADQPGLFFRRAIAQWQIEATYQSGKPTVTGVVTPAKLTHLTLDKSTDPAKCPTGGMSVNEWLNTVVTFR